MKKLLLIVDAQYDFIEGGKLAVNGARKKMNALAEYIGTTKEDYTDIVFTADFHPHNHCSFKDNGGEWPLHCVNYTHGAAIDENVFNAAYSRNIDSIKILTKGTKEDKDEYSIFQNETNGMKLREFMAEKKFDEIHICGIVGTVCVKNTINDLTELLWGDKVIALLPYIVNFNDDDTEFIEWCKTNNVKIIT